MNILLKEIQEIPEKAEVCYAQTRNLILPLRVPYLGMGSSFFAAQTLKYLGFPVDPQIASEYFHYLVPNKVNPLGVLISQSGRSSETLWCKDLFEKYIAITNYPGSALTEGKNMERFIHLRAGDEIGSSTKTYINTLITLYNGCGMDTRVAVNFIRNNMGLYEEWGLQTSDFIFQELQKNSNAGFYILGSGPNISTANHGAIILTESTKVSFQAWPLSQFEHGPQEAAINSVIIPIQTNGPSHERTTRLTNKLREKGAKICVLEEMTIPEKLSPFAATICLSFLAYYLSEKLGVEKPFVIGNKVTEQDL